MKSQSASAAPGIATVPRSVLQVPMTGNVSTTSGGVSVSVSMVSAGSSGSADEEDKEEDEEWGHVDDEQDVDEINHETLPKVVVRVHSPDRRVHRSVSQKNT